MIVPDDAVLVQVSNKKTLTGRYIHGKWRYVT